MAEDKGILVVAGDEPRELAPTAPSVSMFERLARDPQVSVETLERLIAMQERVEARNARAEYYASFAAMQGALPTVIERGKSNTGSYARHEDIVEAVRPVLQKFGFLLTFRTTFPDGGVRVVGVLAHRNGHAEETEFISKPDTSGSKNPIQALGSAQSYGQRYTTRALLNIASDVEDDDGKGTADTPEQPKGYADWLLDLEATAQNGTAELEAAWKNSAIERREFAAKHDGKRWNAIKAKAAKVAAAVKR